MTQPPSPRWGAAVTAFGTRGVAPTSDWGAWIDEGRMPRSGDGNGFGVDFATDLALAAELGLSALRWTIDWARLVPRPGRWDSREADVVTEVLRAAKAAGIDVWAVLHEGPLPGWFTDDQRGFRDEIGLRRTWPQHVDRVAETFGDQVAGWIPVLDPFALAGRGHLTGTRPPAGRDEGEFLDSLHQLHLASYEAMRLLRSGDPDVVACVDVEPAHAGVHSRSPDEREAARSRAATIDRLRTGTWTRALRDGVLSLPGRADAELEGLATGYDVLGITYRGATTVFADGSQGPYPGDAPVAADGHAPWAEGLGLVLRALSDELPGQHLAVVGTGLVDVADEWRVELVHQTATQVERAMADGVAVTDVFWETLVDAWNPDTGLDVPDGVVSRARERRPSAESLRVVASRGARLEP